MAKIKICGLRREADIDYVNELKPDYIGFILSSGFRRSITREQATLLKSKLSPDITAVGVFVNEDVEYINSFARQGIIDIAQLHGNEAQKTIEQITLPVIKYLNPESFSEIDGYNPDCFLFDSGTGTGVSFDWSAIPHTDKPFFLAGGINECNITEAINQVNPYCIDLSSAVETDGFKDYYKIKRIMEKVK